MASPEGSTAGVGQRVAEARARAGLTQADLATTIQMDRSALAKIEIGVRRVSALELARIADAVDERIEWFLETAPPAIVSWRNLRDPGSPSLAIDRLVERIARSVEFVTEHDSHLSLPTMQPWQRPPSVDAIEAMAAKSRQLLGVENDEPVLDLSDRLAAIGLLVFSIDIGPQAADGACVLLHAGGIALVNGQRQVGRRRLTTLHELGHFLVADEFRLDWQIDGGDTTSQWETRLDRFARAVLLPAAGLEIAWNDCRENDDDLRTASVRIASRFRVDMSTLASRLRELNMIDAAEIERVRRFQTTKADIIELDLLNNYELEPPSLPRRYVESVLRLFRSETISAARAMDLFLDTWDEADLPQLPKLPERAIWKFVS